VNFEPNGDVASSNVDESSILANEDLSSRFGSKKATVPSN
jgi:hypothetical protein